MPEKLLLTHASGPSESLLSVVEPNYRAYAERHGYHFEAVRGPVDTVGRSEYWSKVRLIRERLASVDVLVWIDGDFVIRSQDRDIADEFYPEDFQTLCMEYHASGPGPNLGLWMLRNVSEAHEFLDLLWETGDLPGAQLYEQSAFAHLLGFSSPPQFSKPVAWSPFLPRTGWLDVRWNNLYLFNPEGRWRAHAVHFAGIELAEKFHLIRSQLEQDRLPGWEELEGTDWVRLARSPTPVRFPHPDAIARPGS